MKKLEFTIPFNFVPPPLNQLALLMDGNGQIISSIWGSTVPNVQRPGKIDQPNYSEYPVLAPGFYKGKFFLDGHKGKPGIVIDENMAVPIIQVVNPRTAADKTATHIHIHPAYRDDWRGSAGCPTLDPDTGEQWLVQNFMDNEQLDIFIPSPFPWYNYQDIGDYKLLR